jgi:hypothetical protein
VALDLDTETHRLAVELAGRTPAGEEGLVGLDREDRQTCGREGQRDPVLGERNQRDRPGRGDHWAAQELPAAEPLDRRVLPGSAHGGQPSADPADQHQQGQGSAAGGLQRRRSQGHHHNSDEDADAHQVARHLSVNGPSQDRDAHRDRVGLLVVLAQERLPQLRGETFDRVDHAHEHERGHRGLEVRQ